MRTIILALSILLAAAIANAAEKSFTGAWTWTGNEAEIQGFRIKDQDNKVVVDTAAIPPSARTGSGIVTVPDGGCIALFVVAVETNGDESGNSNILNYCLPKPKVVKVDAFSFTIE